MPGGYAPQRPQVRTPGGSEQQPRAVNGKPDRAKPDRDDQGVIETGALRVVHVVQHPEEIPEPPGVVPTLEQLTVDSRDVVAAVPF